MRGGGESQVEAEDQRFRAEKSWRSKHWNKVKKQTLDLKKQTLDLQRSRLALKSLYTPIDKTTQLHEDVVVSGIPLYVRSTSLKQGIQCQTHTRSMQLVESDRSEQSITMYEKMCTNSPPLTVQIFSWKTSVHGLSYSNGERTLMLYSQRLH